MRATCGIFRLPADAERAAGKLRSTGLYWDRITLLVPRDLGKQVRRVTLSAAKQPSVCKAMGTATGIAVGLAGGFELGAVVSATFPVVGPVTAVGFWGAAILGLAGAAVGAAAGNALDNALTDGRADDELFVYEDALRNGLSVVLAFTDDGDTTECVRHILAEEGADSVDKARQLGVGRLAHRPQNTTEASPQTDESLPLGRR